MILLDEIRSLRFLSDCFSHNILIPLVIKLHYAIHPYLCNKHVEEVTAVEAGTRILTFVTAANRFSDARHIDFKCPVRPGFIRTAYSSMLDQELILRHLVWYCNYPIEVKQKYLRLSIWNEDYIKKSPSCY